jgi:hypothetical protein
MIPPEMIVWFGAALLVAGIVLLVGWKLTEPKEYVFEAPEYPRHVPAPPPEPEPTIRVYNGRHRSEP